MTQVVSIPAVGHKGTFRTALLSPPHVLGKRTTCLSPGEEDHMPKPWPGTLKACLLHLAEGKPGECSGTSSQRKADRLDLEVMVHEQKKIDTAFWFTSESSFICYQSPR